MYYDRFSSEISFFSRASISSPLCSKSWKLVALEPDLAGFLTAAALCASSSLSTSSFDLTPAVCQLARILSAYWKFPELVFNADLVQASSISSLSNPKVSDHLAITYARQLWAALTEARKHAWPHVRCQSFPETFFSLHLPCGSHFHGEWPPLFRCTADVSSLFPQPCRKDNRSVQKKAPDHHTYTEWYSDPCT